MMADGGLCVVYAEVHCRPRRTSSRHAGSIDARPVSGDGAWAKQKVNLVSFVPCTSWFPADVLASQLSLASWP